MAGDEFQWYDYLVFAAILAISLGIGVFFALSGGKQRTTKEYLMANRSLGILPVTLSMFMSNTSAILVLGNAAEMYTFGVQAWFTCIGYIAAYLLGALIFIPLFYPLRLVSVFEYLERRYGSRVLRLVASILSLISSVMYMGLAMYTPSTALEAVTPIPVWASVVTMGVIGTIYTMMGGMKAVVWSDVFQGLIYIAGVLTILIIGIEKAGGITNAWNECVEGGRVWVSFDPNPVIRLSMWPLLFGNLLSAMDSVAVSQTSVQRYSSMTSMRNAQVASLLNIPLSILMYTLTYLCGAAVFAYYRMGACDPYRTGQIRNSNQILPYFIVSVLQVPALPGIFVAVLFSGALSSVTSSMNSCAAMVWEDFLKSRYKHLEEGRKTIIVKLLACLFGAMGVAMSFIYQYIPGNVQMVTRTINSAASSPILGIFITAAWFPCSNAAGNIIGALFGFVVCFTVSLGNSITSPWPATLNTTVSGCADNVTINDGLLEHPDYVFPLFGMSYMWYSALGTVTTIVVGVFASFILGPSDPAKQDPKLIAPVFDRVLCCLPNKWLTKLWCGVPREGIKLDSMGRYVQPDSEESVDETAKEAKTNSGDNPPVNNDTCQSPDESQCNTDGDGLGIVENGSVSYGKGLNVDAMGGQLNQTYFDEDLTTSL